MQSAHDKNKLLFKYEQVNNDKRERNYLPAARTVRSQTFAALYSGAGQLPHLLFHRYREGLRFTEVRRREG